MTYTIVPKKEKKMARVAFLLASTVLGGMIARGIHTENEKEFQLDATARATTAAQANGRQALDKPVKINENPDCKRLGYAFGTTINTSDYKKAPPLPKLVCLNETGPAKAFDMPMSAFNIAP